MSKNGSTALAERPAQQEQHPLVAALDQRMPALIDMLPGGEEAARRFKRVLIQAVFRNPDLQKCTPTSILSAAMESAAIGIEPTGTLGGAYLVPYGQTAALIIGYRGLIELARRSGEIRSIRAHVVREGDEFSYRYGSDARVDHVPAEGSDRALSHVYAIAKLRGGDEQFEVMTRAQVEAIRTRSKSGDKGPWKTDYEEMARKTAVRRLIKYLPIAVEARDVIERDDADFEPGAIVERVAALPPGASRTDQAAARAAALNGEVIVQEPEPEPTTEPEQDVEKVPFEPGAEASTGDAGVEAEASAASAPVASDCTHPAELHEARDSGVWCRNCGELLASRAEEEPDKPARQRSYRERLNARIHADRTHEQARLLTAAVLGIAPDAEWSMADLTEEQLAMVVGALEARSAPPPARSNSRRQPAGARR